MKKKWIGILLVIMGCCLGIFCMIKFQGSNQTKEKVSSVQKKSTIKKEKKSVDSQEEIENVEERKEGGSDQDSELISAVEVNLQDMNKEEEALIKDKNKFINEIRRYIFDNGIESIDVYSLDTITTKYNERKQLFLLGIQDENTYFYIIQDMDTPTYSYQEY